MGGIACCSELRARSPPRGVQLTLGTAAAPHVTGTVVMSNLGYFQLQAAPGVWTLSLKPGGSATLYTIASSRSMRETDSSLVSETAVAGESARTQVRAPWSAPVVFAHVDDYITTR